jgi:hypothetical protein
MIKRKESNSLRIETLQNVLCDRGNSYVRDIKNDKVALALVRFLKQQAKSAKEVALNFV